MVTVTAPEEEAVVHEETSVVHEEILDLEKCITQLVLSAEKNVKFLSSRKKADQCTAETVTQRRKDTKTRTL